jgi:hypothetical protein
MTTQRKKKRVHRQIEQSCVGHFIGGNECRFHRNTYINGYIVSTVGEYFPMFMNGQQEIGYQRFYETMVFKAKKINPVPVCGCKYSQRNGHNIDFDSYNDRESAQKGHLDIVEKYRFKTEGPIL